MSLAQFWYLLLLRHGLHYDKQSERGKAIILHLTKEGLCESRCDVGGDGFYVATEKGRGRANAIVISALKYVVGLLASIAAIATFIIQKSQ